MNYKFIIIALLSIFLTSCKTSKNLDAKKNIETLAPIEVVGKRSEYRSSPERKFDLIHTKLDVSFSWEDQFLFGEATLKLKPYFFPQNILELDAKGMDLNQIALINADGSKTDLNYKYDGKIIAIDLGKTYKKEETVNVFIKYISKPNNLEKAEGLEAISDDKGLYFINPLGEDKNKPRQIWTQGEPESNSVWFPTIDKPNERCTQEISITIENNFIAMSNGYVSDNRDNGNGTYTITWRQDKPHAPYLFMMAIGEYAEVKDYYNGMTVNYYVEKEYEAVARQIFGNTPEMLGFFSQTLGVPYPWDKYWQVIVRDYVSGAMENTTASVFGEFVQLTERELLDRDHEDIISHELFHHWFGDLVTCESWSNLPLNESFATYGEVMWREFKYGQDAKYLKVKEDMDAYFREANGGKQVDMIRFRYDSFEDMFDSHSYAKGGVILNMLREIVGDEAFYASLQNYLWTNRYQSVEIHDLRIAFEKTTGQDLNWFFNQWFLSAGHPIIDVEYVYTDNSVKVILTQTPSAQEYLVYRLPIAIDIHEGYNVRRENVIFDRRTQEFEFKTSIKPVLVNVDADNFLLAEIRDTKTEENYIAQYNNAKNLLDKIQALEFFADQEVQSAQVKSIIKKALKDEFWYVQESALSLFKTEEMNAGDYAIVADLAENASKTSVQATAIYLLGEGARKEHQALYERGVSSMSYAVNAASLFALSKVNPKRALVVAESFENVSNYEVIDEVAHVYSLVGDTSKVNYFQKMATNADKPYKKYYAVYHYSVFLSRMDNTTVLEGVDFIENWGKSEAKEPYAKMVALAAVKRISSQFVIKADSYKSELANGKKTLNATQKMALENEYADMLLILDRINEATAALSAE